MKPESLSQKLKRLRKAKGLTQREVATEAGICQQPYQRLEDGTAKDPRLSTAAGLAKVFGVTVDSLVS